MANLNFKKFLRNKNTVTILGVLVCLLILYVGYTSRINAKTRLIDVYYANQTIQPKTLITDEMVSKTSMPESFIKGNYYRNYNDIVGKYSNYNTMIAEGSLFYSDLLVEESNLPDAILYDVNEGERVVSFPVTMESTYGNSIMPGNKVDIYVKIIDDKNKVIYGQFYEKVEILGVKDSAGKNVFENTEEVRTPAYMLFALPEEQHLLIRKALYLQNEYDVELLIVPNTEELPDDVKEQVNINIKYDGYISRQMKQVDAHHQKLQQCCIM